MPVFPKFLEQVLPHLLKSECYHANKDNAGRHRYKEVCFLLNEQPVMADNFKVMLKASMGMIKVEMS